MTARRAREADRGVLIVSIPFQIKKRGGRKIVIAPEGASWSVPRPRVDSTMVKALARAHRWKRLLESGRFASVAELAAAELVVDLRSGSYSALGRVPGAVGVDVIAERPDGRRSVVTHFNKAHKGRLARALASTRSEPDDAAAVAGVARRAGMRVERDGAELTVIVPA